MKKIAKSFIVATGVASLIGSTAASFAKSTNVNSELKSRVSDVVSSGSLNNEEPDIDSSVQRKVSSETYKKPSRPTEGTTSPNFSTQVNNWFTSDEFAAIYAYQFANDITALENFVINNITTLFSNAEAISERDIYVLEDSIIANQKEGTVTLSIYFESYVINGNLVRLRSQNFTMTFTGFKKFIWNVYNDGIKNNNTWFEFSNGTIVRDKLAGEVLRELTSINQENISKKLDLLDQYLSFGPLPYDLSGFKMSITGIANNFDGTLDIIIKTNMIFQEVNSLSGADLVVVKTDDFKNKPFIMSCSSKNRLIFANRGITELTSTFIDLTLENNPEIKKVCDSKNLVNAINSDNAKVVEIIKNLMISKIIAPGTLKYDLSSIIINKDGIHSIPASGIVKIPVTIKNYVTINSAIDKEVVFLFKVNPISVPIVQKSLTYPLLYNVNDAIELLKKDLSKRNYAEQKFISQFLDVSGVNYQSIKVTNITPKNVSVDKNSCTIEFAFKDMPNANPNEPIVTDEIYEFDYSFYSNKLITNADTELKLSPQDKLDDDTLVSSVYPYQAIVPEIPGASFSKYKYDAQIREFLISKAINNKAVVRDKKAVIDASAYSADDITINSMESPDNATGSFLVNFTLKRYVDYKGNEPIYTTNGSKRFSTRIYGFRKAYAGTSVAINPEYATTYKNVLPSELVRNIQTADSAGLLQITKNLINIYNHPYTNDLGVIIDDSKFGNVDIKIVDGSVDDTKGRISLKFSFNGYFTDNSTLDFNSGNKTTDPITFNFLETLPNKTQITNEVHANNLIYESLLASELNDNLTTNPALLDIVKNDVLPSIKYKPEGFTTDNIVSIRVTPGDRNYNNDDKWVNLEIEINKYHDGVNKNVITTPNTVLTTKFFANFRHIESTRFVQGVYLVDGVREIKASEWFTTNGIDAIKDIIIEKIKDNKNQNIIKGDMPSTPITKDDIIIDSVVPSDKKARIEFNASLKKYWEYNEATGKSQLVEGNEEGYKPSTKLTFRGFHSTDITLIPADGTEFVVDSTLSGYYPSDLTFKRQDGNNFTIDKLQEYIWNTGRKADGTPGDGVILDGTLPAGVNPKENVIIENRYTKNDITYVGKPNDAAGTLVITVHLKKIATINDVTGEPIVADPNDISQTDFTIKLSGFKKRIPTSWAKELQISELGSNFTDKIPSEISALNKTEGLLSQSIYTETNAEGRKVLSSSNPIVRGEFPTSIVEPERNVIPPEAQPTKPATYSSTYAAPTPIDPDAWLANDANVAVVNRVLVNDIPLNLTDNRDGSFSIVTQTYAWYDEDDALLHLAEKDKVSGPKVRTIKIKGGENIQPNSWIEEEVYDIKTMDIKSRIPQEVIYAINHPDLKPEYKQIYDIFKQEIYNNILQGSKRNITVDDFDIEGISHSNKTGQVETNIKLYKYWDENGKLLNVSRDPTPPPAPGVDDTVDTPLPLETTKFIGGFRTTGQTNVLKYGIMSFTGFPALSSNTAERVIKLFNDNKAGLNDSPLAQQIVDEVNRVVWIAAVTRENNVKVDSYIEAMEMTKDLKVVKLSAPSGPEAKDTVVVDFKLYSMWNEDWDYVQSTEGFDFQDRLTGFKIGNDTDLIKEVNIYGKSYSDKVGGNLKFGVERLDGGKDLPANLKKIYDANVNFQTLSPSDWRMLLNNEEQETILRDMIILNSDFFVINPPPNLEDAIRSVQITNVFDEKGEIEVTVDFKNYLNQNGIEETGSKKISMILQGWAATGPTKIKEDTEYEITGSLQTKVNQNNILATSIKLDSGLVIADNKGSKISLTEELKQFIRQNAITGYAPTTKITWENIIIKEITNNSNIKRSIDVTFEVNKFFDDAGNLVDNTAGVADPAKPNLEKTVTLSGFYSKNATETIPPKDPSNLIDGLESSGSTADVYHFFFDDSGSPKFEASIFDTEGHPQNAEAIENLKKWIFINTSGTKDDMTYEDIIIDGNNSAFKSYDLLNGSITIKFRYKKYWTATGPLNQPSKQHIVTITGFKTGKITAVNEALKVCDMFAKVGELGVSQSFVNADQALLDEFSQIPIEGVMDGKHPDLEEKLKKLIIDFLYYNTIEKNPKNQIILNAPTTVAEGLPADLQKSDFAVDAMYVKGGTLVVNAKLKYYYDMDAVLQKPSGDASNTGDWLPINITFEGFAKFEETKIVKKARIDISKANGPSHTAGRPTFYDKAFIQFGDKFDSPKFYWSDATPTGLVSAIVNFPDAAETDRLSESNAKLKVMNQFKQMILDKLVINNSATKIDNVDIVNITYNDATGTIKVDYLINRGYAKDPASGSCKPSGISLSGTVDFYGFVVDTTFQTSDLQRILTYSLAGVGVFCVLAVILFIVYKRRRDIEYRQ